MGRFIAIGDIHGCLNTFSTLLNEISLKREDRLVLLGDMIDRGPDSKGVIDKVWKLQQEGFNVRCLRGNHEQILLNCCDVKTSILSWMTQGGTQTLYSFDTPSLSGIPDEYIDWMRTLPCFIEEDGAIFVHAGFNMYKGNPYSDTDSMLWLRPSAWYDHLDREWLNDHIIVHGHTPRTFGETEKQLEQLNEFPVINIDTGCFLDSRRHGLTAFDVTNRKLHSISCRDVVKY